MLLERSDDLAALSESLAEATARCRGQLVLLGGEAGVGKSSLLRAFRDEHEGSHRVLWGACDDLFTPRPLGPLVELAHDAGPELEHAVSTVAHPHEVVEALLGAMGGDRPVVVVLEDVHWADTATLDVIRLLGRRIEASAGLVIASYRDDEPGERLSAVLGDLATRPAVRRLSLAPLSVEGVTELGGPNRLDAQELHRVTGGNPFFVTEVLAAGNGAIPGTVREAVLARARRLSKPARRLLGTVSIEPGHAEIDLLERIEPEGAGHVDECLAAGMLRPGPASVSFRHELARIAVEESLAPDRRLALHRAALEALTEMPGGADDPARLAHHAEASGDRDAVLRFAPAAAERASALGAHREAAAQLERALRFAGDLAPAARAELLERRAYECMVSGQTHAACEALEAALTHRRANGDPLRVGDALRKLSRPLFMLGRIEESRRAVDEAIALLEPLPPGRELAMAYSSAASDSMMTEDLEGTRRWGRRALELAEPLDDLATMAHALSNLGTAELAAGNEEGREQLERSVEIARRLRSDDHIARGLNNLAASSVRQRRYELADAYLEQGLAFADERGHYLLVMLSNRAESRLRRGRLAEAARDAEAMLAEGRDDELPHALALAFLGIVGVRRGDDGALAKLDEAHALVAGRPELDGAVFVALGLAEAAWLEGDAGTVDAVTREALPAAERAGEGFAIGELACWRRRAGIVEEPPHGAAEPFALELEGEFERAAERWVEIGCPFEAAMARAGSDAEESQRRALAMLQDLGAAPAAAIVARRLRARGVRGLPRGPRPSTRENPGNLTARELEVLQLLAEGLPNAGIADRLVLSRRTVDHHVSAILRKLDVGTRGQASAEAVRLGLVELG